MVWLMWYTEVRNRMHVMLGHQNMYHGRWRGGVITVTICANASADSTGASVCCDGS